MTDLISENTLLVTGGLGDIGLAITRKFSGNGWHVAVNDMLPQSDGEDRLASAVRVPAGTVRYWECDNTDPVAVEAMMSAIVGQRGVPNVIAVNAGVVEPVSILEMTPDRWRRHLDVNLTGAFHVAQAAARQMVANSGGTILFTSSWVQDVPSRGIGAYCVSKAGLKMLARQMALELAPHNIRVNVVAPGVVDAGLSGRMFRSGEADVIPFQRAIPLGYLQTADQAADAFWLLAQPEAAYITGASLLCDGGMSLFNWQNP